MHLIESRLNLRRVRYIGRHSDGRAISFLSEFARKFVKAVFRAGEQTNRAPFLGELPRHGFADSRADACNNGSV